MIDKENIFSFLIRPVISSLVFLIWTISLLGQDHPVKVLFVGNSYTYFWNLPQHVESMAESTGDLLDTYQSTAGGSHWGHHWRGERGLKTVDKIKNEGYDIVVLQNHSMSTINRKDSLHHFGNLLYDLARQSGARILLYETWSREWDPYMLDVISRSYREFGDEIGADIAPVGQAWNRALQLRPDISLYDADGSHPSPVGTYLTACVFYTVLTGKTARGLPNRLISKDEKGEKIYLNVLPPGDALFCQKVADDIFSTKTVKN